MVNRYEAGQAARINARKAYQRASAGVISDVVDLDHELSSSGVFLSFNVGVSQKFCLASPGFDRLRVSYHKLLYLSI